MGLVGAGLVSIAVEGRCGVGVLLAFGEWKPSADLFLETRPSEVTVELISSEESWSAKSSMSVVSAWHNRT